MHNMLLASTYNFQPKSTKDNQSRIHVRGGRKTFKIHNMSTESVIRGRAPLAKPSANRKRGCSGDRERAEGGKKMKV